MRAEASASLDDWVPVVSGCVVVGEGWVVWAKVRGRRGRRRKAVEACMTGVCLGREGVLDVTEGLK